MFIIKEESINYKGQKITIYYTGRYRESKIFSWSDKKEITGLSMNFDINKAKKWKNKKVAEEHLTDWHAVKKDYRSHYENENAFLSVVDYNEELAKYTKEQEKANRKHFWVSGIMQDSETSKPWLSAMTDSCRSMEEAMETIKRMRYNYRVLSAWVDTFENNKKQTIFHECYINAIGSIEN